MTGDGVREEVPSDWASRLALAVAETVREFVPVLREAAVELFAIDCHPWHGTVDLAVLTANEVSADPELADPSGMAAWEYYCFSDGLIAWRPVAALGAEMRAEYEAAASRPTTADGFLRACAQAAVSPEVAAAIEKLNRTLSFRLTVTHPDDGREFVLDRVSDTEPDEAEEGGDI